MAAKKIVSRTSFVDLSKVGQRRPAGTGSVYQGTGDAEWECNSCGHGPIQGYIKTCPTCGNPKDSSENYTAPSGKRPYLTQDELQKRGVDLDHGSDEECPYCHARIAPKTEVCPHCNGNVKDVSKTNRICPNCTRETNQTSCPACGVDTDPKTSQNLQSQYSSYTPITAPSPSNFGQYLKIGAIAGLIALVIFILVMIFMPKIKTGSVVSSNWSCEVPRQEYQYNLHGDWSLPDGADFVKSYDKFHHNDQVYVRTDRVCEKKWEKVGSHPEPDTKEVCDTDSVYVRTDRITYDDGTYDDVDVFEDVTTCEDVPTTKEVDDYDWVEHCDNVKIYEDVPVNATWYEYNIWEWASIAPSTTSGKNNTIICPVVTESQTIKQSGNPSISCEITFDIEGKQYPYKPNCNSAFPKYKIESKWQITLSGPIITKIEPLP